MHIGGGCLCGEVRFAGDTEPQCRVKCYCADCRRTGGAGHLAMMGFVDGAIASAPDEPNVFAPQVALCAARAPRRDAADSAIPAFAAAPQGA
jgi:hypothetical protein